MVSGVLGGLDRLLDGPAFADELGMGTKNEELRNLLEIRHFRIVPPRSAMSGIFGIYFFERDAEEAIIQYCERYRWVVEVLIKMGMSGRMHFESAGLPNQAIEFLEDIIPEEPKNINPVVYQILWKGSDASQYLYIASELEDERGYFTPLEIIERNESLSESDKGYFSQFVRHHLIESKDTIDTKRHHRGGAGGDSIHVNLNEPFQVTTLGRESIPDIVSEFDRLFIMEEFLPLRTPKWQKKRVNGDRDTSGYEAIELATSDEDEVLNMDDTEQSNLSEFT